METQDNRRDSGKMKQREEEIIALRAENKRLRAALREIAADSFSVYAIEVARAALDLPSGKAQ